MSRLVAGVWFNGFASNSDDPNQAPCWYGKARYQRNQIVSWPFEKYTREDKTAVGSVIHRDFDRTHGW